MPHMPAQLRLQPLRGVHTAAQEHPAPFQEDLAVFQNIKTRLKRCAEIEEKKHFDFNTAGENDPCPVISIVHKNLTSFHPSPLPKKETPEVTQPIFEPFCKVTKSSYPTKRTWEHHGTTNIAVATEISLTSTDGWIIATISINRHKGDHDLWHPPYHPPPLSLRPLHCASGFLFFPPLAFGSSSGGLPWDWDSCQPEKVSLQMQAHFVEIHEHYLIELSNRTLLLCTVHWNEFI